MAAVKFRVPNGLQADDDLVVATDVLFVDVSADHVGIGTASPNAALEINNGTGKVLIDDSADWMIIGNGTAAGGVALRGDTPGSVGTYGSVYVYGTSHATYPNQVSIRAGGVDTVRFSSAAITVSSAELVLAAGTTSYPPLNFPAGVGPSSPGSGDVWSTGDKLKFYDNAATTRTFAFLSDKITDFAAPTSSLSMNSQTITNLGTPTNSTDAATKGYVDNVAAGLDPKGSVRVVSTTNITLSGAQTIDGVSVIAGDRVLVAGQSSAATNGIYVCAAGAWSRATDADTSAEVTSGLYVWVEEGTTNADTGWVLTTNNPITLDTTALTFTQFSGLGQITAGSGLTKTGNTLNVGAGTGITVNADDIQISASYAGQNTIVTLGTVTTGTWNATAVTPAYGGTGQTTYTIGDLLQATGATTLSKLAAVATGNALISGGVGTASSWGKIGLTTHVSGTLPEANGGTNQSTYTTGDLLQATASNTLGKLAAVATGNALISGGVGTASSWGKIGLTTHITGTLGVGNGGTGQTSLTQYALLVGNAGSAVTMLANGTTGQLLQATSSSNPSWVSSLSLPAGGTITINPASGTGTTTFQEVSNTTTALTQYTLATVTAASYPAYVVFLTAKEGTNILVTKLHVVTDGTTSTWTEYGRVVSGTAPVSIDVDYSAGSRIRITPASTNSTRCHATIMLMN